MNKYDDIINYNYQMKHSRMPIKNRAAQFAPFSALTGYSEMILEVARKTDDKIELSDNEKEKINITINEINKMIKNKPLVTIKYFLKDMYKKGGKYISITQNVRIIDLVNKEIILTNKEKINISDIVDIKINKKTDD